MGVPWRNLPAFHAELERAGYVTDAITYKSYWALWKALSSADETTEVSALSSGVIAPRSTGSREQRSPTQ